MAKRESEPPIDAELAAAYRRFLESHLAVAGLTRTDIDRILGAKPGYTSRLLRGAVKLTAERCRKIEEVLGLTEEAVLEEVGRWVKVLRMRAQADLVLPLWWPRKHIKNEGYERGPVPPLEFPEIDTLQEVYAKIEEVGEIVLARIAAEKKARRAKAKARKAARSPRRPRKRATRKPKSQPEA